MRGGGRKLQHQLGLALWRRVAESARNGAEESAERSLAAAVRALRMDSRLRHLLLHPGLSVEERLKLLKSLVPLDSTTEDLFRALIGRRAIGLLGGVLRTYRSLRDERAEEARAIVDVAAPISSREAGDIRSALERALGRKVRIKVRTRPAVLGGFMIRVGGRIIDGTVSGAFDRLERQLLAG